jgi:hypothetical protein
MRLFTGKLALTLTAFILIPNPGRAFALRGHVGGALIGLATQTDPPVSRAKQEADKRVAITKPGYYAALLVTNRQARLLPSARARVAVVCDPSLCRGNPMPVKLIRFSGERLDETQVKLTWETSEEVNNDYFGIQRSLNPALGFETIASVKGAGASSRPIAYQTIDPNTYADYTYYRLKQVDLDGTFTYSSIIAVKGGLPLLSVKAFPNPSQRQNITFEVGGAKAEDYVSVTLHDAQGRTLYQNEQHVLDAKLQFVLPNVSGLQPGHYYVKIKANNQQATTSFIMLQ